MDAMKCPHCGSGESGTAQFCSSCGTRLAGNVQVEPAAPISTHAKRERINHNNGGGCLVALLGLCVIWFFPIGTIAGVVLIVMSSRISYKFVCSSCGNPLEKTSRECPTCRASIA